jgi:hypothetical protein
VGESIASDLVALGYHVPADLRGEDAEAMYARSCEIAGVTIDRCLLYTFRCAVYYATAARHEPELLHWWSWTDERMLGRKTDPLGKRLA